MCGAQAFWSPILGAFATPAWWQVAHTAFTMSSPMRLPAAACGAPTSSLPTGWMRSATFCGSSAPGSGLGTLVASSTSIMMTMIGTMKASKMTTISCRGVLMNDECWSCSITGLGLPLDGR